MHVHNERNFPQAKLDSEINVPFLFNENGDLYFLSHNNSAHIVVFNLKKCIKFYRKEKKIEVNECTKPLLFDANYDHENNDYTNDLRPLRFK